MNKPKNTNGHTPGPWEFYIPQSNAERFWIEHPKTGESIADILIPGIGESEARANAYLIASVPDLLEVLESMHNIAVGNVTPSPELVSRINNMAKQAIAKAKGES